MTVAEARRVTVERVMSPVEATELVGKMVGHLDPTVRGATVAHDTDGTPVFAYLPMPRERVAQLRRACLGAKFGAGVWRSQMGFTTSSITFGSAPRKPIQAGREGCNRTGVWSQQPDVEAALEDLSGYFAATLTELDPELVAADRQVLDRVGADWRIGGDGLWTSGVLNKNSQLPYHRDSLNFETWSAMPVLRRQMRGGHLHLPEYDTVLPCRDGWAVYWCGRRLVHAVTPLHPSGPDAYRYSAVYYALRGMKDCFTHAEEQRYARTRRTEREDGMAARLASGEPLYAPRP